MVEVTGEKRERRENGRYWSWQFKVDSYTVCDFETPRILMEVISDLNKFGVSRAKRMVETYGTDIVHILENEHQLLYPWGNSPGERVLSGARRLKNISCIGKSSGFSRKVRCRRHCC